MIVVDRPEHLEIIEGLVERQRKAGVPVDLLDAKEARRMQPSLGETVLAATWCQEDGEVDPLNLVFATARAAVAHGARILLDTEVNSIKATVGHFDVVTPHGVYECGALVNAAGAYAPRVSRFLGLDHPIVPRRGQILVSERLPSYLSGHVLSSSYIVAKHQVGRNGHDNALGIGLSAGQTCKGNLLVGGCREFVGYDNSTTPEALQAISRNALTVLPSLSSVSFIHSYAGLRPYTPDGLPLIGETEVPGFFVAAGHEGDGIALSPITGQLVACEILGRGKACRELCPSRFNHKER